MLRLIPFVLVSVAAAPATVACHFGYDGASGFAIRDGELAFVRIEFYALCEGPATVWPAYHMLTGVWLNTNFAAQVTVNALDGGECLVRNYCAHGAFSEGTFEITSEDGASHLVGYVSGTPDNAQGYHMAGTLFGGPALLIGRPAPTTP